MDNGRETTTGREPDTHTHRDSSDGHAHHHHSDQHKHLKNANTDGEAQGNANNKHNDKDNGSKASTQDEQCNVHMSTRMEYVSNPTDDKYNHQSFSIL